MPRAISMERALGYRDGTQGRLQAGTEQENPSRKVRDQCPLLTVRRVQSSRREA